MYKNKKYLKAEFLSALGTTKPRKSTMQEKRALEITSKIGSLSDELLRLRRNGI
jgi:hypothetical protein